MPEATARPGGGAAGEQGLVAVNEELILSGLRQMGLLDESRRALERATYAAQFDALTGLPNHTLLLDRISTSLARAQRERSGFALMFVDLDQFKSVNDRYGHAVGNALLQHTARLLTSGVRAEDTVSRYGGDEFVLLLPHAATEADAEVVARHLESLLARPARIGQHSIALTASVGIAFHPDHGGNADDLLRHADAAMYRAKSARRQQQDVAAAAFDHSLRDANEQLLLSALGARSAHAATQLAFERQSAFLALLAHELRAPLGPIRNATELLARAPSDDMIAKARQIIERQVVQISRLVDDVFDTVRIRTGRLKLSRAVLDLRPVMQSSIDNCRPAIDRRRQVLELSLPQEPVQVDGDALRLLQVLDNLIGNASKYTPMGGTIQVTLSSDDPARARIVVLDTGIGITTTALEQVFDPFVQEAHAREYDASGLGLGLTMVRELVLAHEGSIRVHSAGRGCGSRFEVLLPRVGDAAIDRTQLEPR